MSGRSLRSAASTSKGTPDVNRNQTRQEIVSDDGNENEDDIMECDGESDTDNRESGHEIENSDSQNDGGERASAAGAAASSSDSTSLLDKYFTRLEATEEARCKTCSRILQTPGKTTTTLSRHLERWHKKLYNEYTKEQEKKKLAIAKRSKGKFKKLKGQPSITDAFKKVTTFPRDNKQAKKITRKILEMIALDYQPISIVEDKGFRALINLLEPRYVLPSRKWLSGKGLPDLYQEIRGKIQEEIDGDLSAITSLSFTVDGWSSRSKEGYLSLTLQYANKEGFPKNFTLECNHFPGEHSGETIYEKVKEMTADWGIDIEDVLKDIYVVSDSARNMTSAFSNKNVVPIKCAVHMLQTVVDDSMIEADQEIETLLSKCRLIVGHYNHSNKSHERLQQVQKRLGLKEHELIQSVDTRWNSTYLMLDRLKEQKEALCVDLPKVGKIGKKSVDLTNDDWEKIGDLSTVLAPVYEATLELGREDCPTLSMVLPIVSSIQQTLSTSMQTSTFARKLKSALLRHLRSRFGPLEHENHYLLATVLDPRFKLAMFETGQTVNVKNILRQATSSLARRAAHEEPEPTPEVEEESAQDKGSIWNILKSKSRAERNPAQGRVRVDPIQEEIDKYLNLELIDPTADAYAWWRANKDLFPNLFKLALKYLGIPASSLTSEREFSKAGQIVTVRRANLKPLTVKILVFLHCNLT
ncbi:zinc finger BED domain-containing protein 4-like [Frankliniella occidentalis]|uniref:Zinc finger BED domain-containing protein 4-like n=1 Tax=Frankliniella occidentalis TaxID=133901 RepID=A0A6J1STW4_FRAOC|nr:zinc finger BED domain-containing protein 4-like [Frankliniella occidentalis]